MILELKYFKLKNKEKCKMLEFLTAIILLITAIINYKKNDDK